MSIKIKLNNDEDIFKTIIWDRDSFFIDFNNYWSRIVGSIAQQVAEKTTADWVNFNVVRNDVIHTLGINPETQEVDFAGPALVIPAIFFPSLITTTLKKLLHDKKREELNCIFHEIVKKVLDESQKNVASSILADNLKKIFELESFVKQILVTNDTKENNDFFIKEGKLEKMFCEIYAHVNKEQLDNLISKSSVFVTKNSYLKALYLQKGIQNVLLLDNIIEENFIKEKDETIQINIDGASRGNPGPSAIGIVTYKNGCLLEEISEYIGEKTNNFAEYTALIKALEISIERGFNNVEIRSDSELVVKQINKEYKVKDADIKELFDKANELITKIKNVKIIHVKREDNLKADKLANNALKGIENYRIH